VSSSDSTGRTGPTRSWPAPGPRSPAAAGTPRTAWPTPSGAVSASTSCSAPAWIPSPAGPGWRARSGYSKSTIRRHRNGNGASCRCRKMLASFRWISPGTRCATACARPHSTSPRPPLPAGWAPPCTLQESAIEQTLAVTGGFAPGSEIVVDYMLPAGLRDAAGDSYAEQVGQASAERGEPWLSLFAPDEAPARISGNAPARISGNAPARISGNAPARISGNAPAGSRQAGSCPMTDPGLLAHVLSA
jgi:hypothetical protein